ncbi:3-mercaptopyruvate sulfurtransferase [Lichenihabitans sp. Uapishka_5]|uniref:3-mercaptopyruvate sulfurtransferase n=1 Tax=Lichenihabitans sp. Uapishka_5 TaxID=3037302 RepID=UPI0029E7D743|nr:3-mercaptopyruvate sulfurtransferase [Lichenihabitans sp. Uapishka_5]MDX7953262.1 3-mercaptopyruvate sulfurtransferase [Lichenihabitans sp. Uapishka_5]
MSDSIPDPAKTAPFVSPQWLADHLDDPAVVPIDGSWYLPTQNRNAAAEFADAHVPGATFLDIEALADQTSPLPHMLPETGWFGREAGALGIPSDATLVVYDGAGLFSAPRVWWTLKAFGARDVRILEGGLPAWRAANLPLESGRSKRPPARFDAVPPGSAVADLAAVEDALGRDGVQVIDARPAGRFTGDTPEPRPGLAAGHMPGSLNLPAMAVIADGRLKSIAALRAVFADAGINPMAPTITSCGSGVTAAILTLALARLGNPDTRLYDGSWAEYGSKPALPVATG